MRVGEMEGEVGLRYPIRGIFVDCCASTLTPARREREHYCEKPHPFSILDFRFLIVGAIIQYLQQSLLHVLFSSNPKSAIENPKLFDDLVRSRQHARRNRQTDLLRRFQINHKLKLPRLFDW
jgi:hypothetical protein